MVIDHRARDATMSSTARDTTGLHGCPWIPLIYVALDLMPHKHKSHARWLRCGVAGGYQEWCRKSLARYERYTCADKRQYDQEPNKVNFHLINPLLFHSMPEPEATLRQWWRDGPTVLIKM